MGEPAYSLTLSELATAEALIDLVTDARPDPEANAVFKLISKEAFERTDAILSNWHTLGKILDRHEGNIRNRWTKKSVTWRKTILSKTWPNMALCHRPDIRYFENEAKRFQEHGIMPTVEEKAAAQDFFLMPYINMEDLSRDKPVLCLLNSRARNPPSRHVDCDLENCEFGTSTRNLKEGRLPGYSMQLDGDTVETYGRLISVRDDLSSRAGYSPGAGLWVLDIQKKLVDFLVKFCEAILDKTADALLSQFNPVAQLAPLQTWFPWRTIENLTTYTPYTLPPELDFSRLANILYARYSLAQDHIKALREDPAYFKATALQFGDHRPECIPDRFGRPRSTHGEPQFWDSSFSAMIHHVHRSVVFWDVLYQQCLTVLDTGMQYKDELDPRYPLPPEYRKQIQLFHGLLRYCSEDQRRILCYLLPTSPPFRVWFQHTTANGKVEILIREDADMENDPLLWVYSKIRDEAKFDFYGHKTMVDEMERLIFSDPEQRKRISPLVAEHFSGFGLLTLMRYEIEKYPPWGAELGFTDQGNIHWITEEIPKILSSDFYELGQQSTSLVLGRFGTPHLVNFSYPCDQRRTRDNAHAMWKAEKNLDVFWFMVDIQYEKLTGKTLMDAFANRFTIEFKLERTQEWVEPVEGLFPEETAHKDQSLEAKTLETTLYGLQVQDKDPENPEQDKSPIQKGIIKLDQRAFRVVKALFYIPSDQDGPRAIPWADFLHFMSLMSFTPMKYYGDLWHFFNFGAIACQFHEPQPDSIISLRNAMAIGRRLRRTYNWHLELFAPPEGGVGRKPKGRKKSKGKSTT